MEPEAAEGKYLYAIIECSEPREFRVRGIGERGDLVHTINHRRLAAVVSDSPVIEYDNSRRNLMAHMLVLDEVMEEFDLLPVRFGTISPNPEAIRTKLLAPRYDEFTQLLGGMEGRVEHSGTKVSPSKRWCMKTKPSEKCAMRLRGVRWPRPIMSGFGLVRRWKRR